MLNKISFVTSRQFERNIKDIQTFFDAEKKRAIGS